ncbi:DEAD/DEAH box helicase family protein [Pelagicoccus sp. NFK12]|uniref:DEAD/DEAH box helicase family protein n=1 Tax=Pelagicoccus enzymogenes TaxID=2773457 RepID=A0A927F5M9_9BACT|nr:helicase C-terminal domain-containing protein [Pelagicoccus enzymogenes]MBD5778627.1 DEAD/DEAH box helicase family protein [Pelagicoccus enzymogenes]
MQIDARNRQATLSVGEFSAFTPYATPGFGGVSAAWRAQLGTEWHQRIQRESADAGEGMQDEVSLSGALAWRNWTLHLSGRIDQFKASPTAPHLREIKTLSEPVPLDREAILERYPAYPLQLLTYRELLIQAGRSDLGRDPAAETFRLELLFVEIGSGLTQSLVLDKTYDGLFVDHLDTLVDYLEAKQERLARLRSLSVRPAYDTPRPGQEHIQTELAEAFSQSQITLLEAPTGYGKTGVAWEYAARRLAAGQCDRVLYLTSKSTGQTEALTRLKALLSKATLSKSPESDSRSSASPPATFWHIRNKQEHCIHHEFRCSRQTCPYLAELHEKWKRSGLQRLYLLSQDELDLETLRAEGRVTGICPYEIMRAGLGQRDIWVGDYNYLFSPSSARLLADQADFDPARTFLIVDEAHNLPSRVASAYTHEFSVHPVYAALDDLNANKAPAALRNHFKILANLLTAGGNSPTRSATSDSEVDPATEADFRHSIGKVSELLNSEPLAYEELQPDTLELLFQISSAHAGQLRGELKHQLWSPHPGTFRLECIDASKLIQSQLSQYNGALFLSATLTPLESYLDEIGLEPGGGTAAPRASTHPQISHLTPPAPWRSEAYDVAIDLRVDTRFKSRRNHLPTTAATIAQAAEFAGPTIAFFPSYAYAKQAYEHLQLKHSELRVALQPRAGGSLADRNAYLEETLAFHDVLILILGSSYAEGVDTLGGKAGTAIVVSPALPEMNFIQEAKREHHDNLGHSGFERAYLHPGIQKVNQALGRLVRSPEHKVKALLHCQRFADPKTKRLLDPLYQSKSYIHEESDLREWLNK